MAVITITIGAWSTGKSSLTISAKLVGVGVVSQPVFEALGVTLPVNGWTTILSSRTTNVSVPTSYTLSAVSAVHRM